MLSVAVLTGCAYVPMKQFPGIDLNPPPATVRDDPMSEAVAVLSKRDEQHIAGMSVHRHELQLVGFVNRETTAANYAVRWKMRHSMGRWFFPRSATYLLADGKPVHVELLQVDRGNVEFCSGGVCTYEEGASFSLPASVVAALVDPSNGPGLRVRINGSGGYHDAILTAAIARTVATKVAELQGARVKPVALN